MNSRFIREGIGQDGAWIIVYGYQPDSGLKGSIRILDMIQNQGGWVNVMSHAIKEWCGQNGMVCELSVTGAHLVVRTDDETRTLIRLRFG